MKSDLLRAFFLALICNYMLLFPLIAQNDLSLEAAIEQALNSSNLYKIVQSNQKITSLQNHWGEAGRHPTVTANINNSNTYSNIQNPTSFLNGAQILGTNTTFSLDMQWVLYDGGRVKASKQRLSALAAQTGLDAQVLVNQITQQVAKAYVNVLVQAERLNAQAKVLALSREKINYIKVKQEFGQAGSFDLLQIQDAYLNDSIQWLLQEVSYQNARQNLMLAMGQDANSDMDFRMADSLNYELPNYEYENLEKTLLSNNAELKLEQSKISIAELDIALQKAALLPRISFAATLSDQLTLSQVNGSNLIPSDWQGGSTISGALNFSMAYTIYNGGRLKRSVEVAKLRRQIATLNLTELERNLTQQLKIANNLYQNQQKLLKLSQELLENAKKNLQIAEERFRANTLNYFDLRTIQINYIRALNAVQNAFLNAKNTEFDLLLLSGELTKKEG